MQAGQTINIDPDFELSMLDKFIMVSPLIMVIISSLVILAGAIALSASYLVGGIITGTGVILALLIHMACWRKILSSPPGGPEVGLVTIWGKRKARIIKEGWHLFAPFPPFLYDAILVPVKTRNKDFTPADVRTQDMAELAVNISTTYIPATEDPYALRNYITNQGTTGVEKILTDMMAESARRRMTEETTWEDGIKIKGPLSVKIIEDLKGLDHVEAEKINASLSLGQAILDIPSLGIVLMRLNIGAIKPLGELAKDAERRAREAAQRDGERIEQAFVLESAKKLKDELNLSPKDAIEVVQTERGKVTKTIQEFKGLEGSGVIGAVVAKLLGGPEKK